MTKQKFNVYVTETLSTVVTIEADNAKEALEQIQAQYDNQEIVLDYNDFDSVEFDVE